MARLRATDRVHLTATARFRGTVETPHLVIEEGAEAAYSDEIPVKAVPFGSQDNRQTPVMTTVAEFPDPNTRRESEQKSADPGTTPESELAGD